MNARQEARMKSNMVTLEKLEDDKVTSQKIPNYAEIRAEIEDYIKETDNIIKSQMELEKSDVKVVMKLKHTALISGCIDFTQKLHAFTLFTNNGQLKEFTEITPSSIKRLSPTNLIARTQIILENAKKYLPELVNYSIAQADIDELALSLKNYQEYLPKPQIEINESKNLTQKLAEIDKKTSETMKKMDTQVLTMQRTYPDFVNEYFVTRKLIYHNREVSILGVISDKTTSEPIHNAKLYFTPVNNKRKSGSIIKPTEWFSAKKGGYRIRYLVAGEYDLTVKMIGYETFTAKVFITNTEPIRLDIKLSLLQ